ncbi:hypothetical protein JTB14_011183 [Gonioctena quinquepunctata]|nr:hypothetical protein JTB14_011183 [Gonioctena quinquepunctata]
MCVYMANGEMCSSAAGTANFLEKLDHLFDILNSSTTKTTNQNKKPYKGTEDQETFLRSMLISLENMKVFKQTKTGKKDITGLFSSISCFQITIRSVMILWNDLKKEGLKQMKTRRLNQDCIENFFGKIRQQGGNSVNPTPIQFMNAFKKLSCMDLLDCVDTFNCAADVDVLLMSGVQEVRDPVGPKIIPQKKQTFRVLVTENYN